MDCEISKSTNCSAGSSSANQNNLKKIGIVGTASFISKFALTLKQNGVNIAIQSDDMLKDDYATLLKAGISILSSVDYLIESCDVIVGAFEDSLKVANFFTHHISQRFYRRSFVDMTTHDDEDIAEKLPTALQCLGGKYLHVLSVGNLDLDKHNFILLLCEGDRLLFDCFYVCLKSWGKKVHFYEGDCKARLIGVLVNGFVNSMIFQVINSFDKNNLPIKDYLDAVEEFGVDRDLLQSCLSNQHPLKLVENMNQIVKNFDVLEKYGQMELVGKSKQKFKNAVEFILKNIKENISI